MGLESTSLPRNRTYRRKLWLSPASDRPHTMVNRMPINTIPKVTTLNINLNLNLIATSNIIISRYNNSNRITTNNRVLLLC